MLSNLENVGVHSNGIDETIKQIGNRLTMHMLHESDYFVEFEHDYENSAEVFAKKGMLTLLKKEVLLWNPLLK